MEWQDDFLTLCLSRMSFKSETMPCRYDRSFVTNALQINRCESMVEGKVINTSQAFNYCKLMVMICKEAMAGNHSLRCCKPIVCKWT
ncbi:hypothetical protein ACB092_11G038100 [Castanea dentata]